MRYQCCNIEFAGPGYGPGYWMFPTSISSKQDFIILSLDFYFKCVRFILIRLHVNIKLHLHLRSTKTNLYFFFCANSVGGISLQVCVNLYFAGKRHRRTGDGIRYAAQDPGETWSWTRRIIQGPNYCRLAPGSQSDGARLPEGMSFLIVKCSLRMYTSSKFVSITSKTTCLTISFRKWNGSNLSPTPAIKLSVEFKLMCSEQLKPD